MFGTGYFGQEYFAGIPLSSSSSTAITATVTASLQIPQVGVGIVKAVTIVATALIQPAIVIRITAPIALAGGNLGISYGPATFAATGGSGSYAWSATGLPTGVILSPAGALSGIPSGTGVFNPVFTVRDAVSGSSTYTTLPLSVTIAALTITGPSSLHSGYASLSYAPVFFSAVGGTGGYTWSASLLPSGMSLSSSGVLTGVPSVVGTYSPHFTATDSSSTSTTIVLSLTITSAVSASFTTTMPGASANYMGYLFSNPVKTDSINQAALLDFSLAAADSSFVKLKRGAYIDINTTQYPHWFTGYVTNDPQYTYLGVKNGQPAWGYTYQATGDEYLLSLNPLGLIRPFMNVHMGVILKRVISLLAPGVFDVSNIQDGPLLAQYTIDPTKKFVDLTKELCTSANYVFFGKSKYLYFMPQNDPSFPPTTLDGSNTHFTPSRLTLKPSASPIINDVTVLGETEPQKYMTEYFVGTGLEGSFPLATSVFGVDTSVLLTEDFTNTGLDSSLWSTNDVSSSLVVASGYLNVIGGTSYLQSLNPIPLEGNIRLTHGEWDFLAGYGIVCALYSQTPTSGATNCVYGLNISGTLVNPIVNGAVDSSQSFTLDYTKRYVIRTLAEFSRMHRLAQPYSYIDSSGVVQSVGGTAKDSTVTWHTIITEINPNGLVVDPISGLLVNDPKSGLITRQVTFTNATTLTSSVVFASYVPVLSQGLHATVSGITISVPVNATLAVASLASFNNMSFNGWDDTYTIQGWASQNVLQETVFQDGFGSACKFFADPANPTNRLFVSQDASKAILPLTEYDYSMRVRVNPAMLAGTLTMSLKGTNADGSAFLVTALTQSVTAIPDAYVTLTGVLTLGINVIPPDLTLVIEITGVPTGVFSGMWVDNLSINTKFIPKLIGPNEIDASDGLAPYATITSSNTGAPTKDVLFGTAAYNAGQSQLVFFKNSVNRTSTTPPTNQVVRLSYRSAGSAIGRVVSTGSIAAEAATWGDLGYRSVIRKDISPRPRNSYECELAALAIVAENVFQHFEGTYTQFSPYVANEPRAGSIFQLINVPGIAPSFAAEQITQVVTTFECEKSNPQIFNHVITFSKSDNQLQSLLSAIGTSIEYQKNNNSVTNPSPLDMSLVGLNYQDDVTQPRLVSWGANMLNFTVGPTTGSVEVRSTDNSWGGGTSKNLVATSSSTFSVAYTSPTSARTKTLFMKQVA